MCKRFLKLDKKISNFYKYDLRKREIKISKYFIMTRGSDNQLIFCSRKRWMSILSKTFWVRLKKYDFFQFSPVQHLLTKNCMDSWYWFLTPNHSGMSSYDPKSSSIKKSRSSAFWRTFNHKKMFKTRWNPEWWIWRISPEKNMKRLKKKNDHNFVILFVKNNFVV